MSRPLLYVPIHVGFETHPRIRRASRELGRHLCDPSVASIYIMRLWLFAGQHASDGDLGDMTPDDIADGVGWAHDPDILWNALAETGLIEEHGDGWRCVPIVPGQLGHCGTHRDKPGQTPRRG
jgi:hypothetical protein